MNRFVVAMLVALVSFAAAVVRGAEGETILVVTKGGYYTLQTDATGTPQLKKVGQVITLGETPPTDPPTTPGTAFEKEITRLTQAALSGGASKQTGARISSVYATVAGSVADGSIPPARALEALKLGTDLALSGQADSAKWAAWRNDVGDALTALAQEGKLQTKEQYAGVIREIERGVNAATGFPGAAVAREKGEGILDGFDLAKIIELIKLLLELFKIFKPS